MPPIKSTRSCAMLVFRTLGYFLLLSMIATAIAVHFSGDKTYAPAPDKLLINDITGLNATRVNSVIEPVTVEDIIAAIKFTPGKLSIGGGRFSQGGQISATDTLHIDMRHFNKILHLDKDKKEVTVQTGVTWRQLQEFIDPYNLSIKIMQTYANFTIGGSLSVNVHGRYIGEGPLVRSVRSIKMVTADGDIVSASPDENRDIFYGAIGGYGGLGVIVEATLSLADNTPIERSVSQIPINDYPGFFVKNIRDNKNVVMQNGDIYPPNYDLVNNVDWEISTKPLTNPERMIAADQRYILLPWLADFTARFSFGKWLRQHVIEPIYYTQPRVVWRNWEASYNISELQSGPNADTAYGLREYFVPVARFNEFIPKMRDIFQRHHANILNVSIRHALPDTGTLLAWAREEVFAFVVYYQQETTQEARAKVGQWTREMTDAALSVGGSYYLPYQIFATTEQFAKAYPGADEYFSLKEILDPNNRFTNKLWQTYYPGNQDALSRARSEIRDYNKPEEQTYLTIPEWYLVFNPKEYSEFLEAGRNPSDFPFIASINEYWTLYDRVVAIAKINQAHNSEYITMLDVIGISTTFEYLLKSAYENTAGRFSRWTASEETPEEKLMRQAYRAYSDLIYDKAWYEFNFFFWVKRIWTDCDFFGKNFIRKTERKLFFTLEFGLKAIYAKAIGYAAKNSYEASSGVVNLTATAPENFSPQQLPANTRIIAIQGRHWLIQIPRWQAFTKTIPLLVQFDDISGNSLIAATITLPANALPNYPYEYWFTSEFVSNPELVRIVQPVHVKRLHQFLNNLSQHQATLEHLYDY